MRSTGKKSSNDALLKACEILNRPNSLGQRTPSRPASRPTHESSMSNPGIALSGCTISDCHVGVYVDSTSTVTVNNLETRGCEYGVFQSSSTIADQSEKGGGMVTINQNGRSRIDGRSAGVSVPEGSSIVINQNDDAVISGHVGVEERTARMEELRGALQAGVPQDVIDEAIAAVLAANGNRAAQETAVKESRLWKWVKDYGGDVVGLVVKAAIASM